MSCLLFSPKPSLGAEESEHQQFNIWFLATYFLRAFLSCQQLIYVKKNLGLFPDHPHH